MTLETVTALLWLCCDCDGVEGSTSISDLSPHYNLTLLFPHSFSCGLHFHAYSISLPSQRTATCDFDDKVVYYCSSWLPVELVQFV